MSGHLSTQELLDARYGLLEGQAAAAVAAHLAECAECRARGEQLAARLGQLELLREEVPVPGELLARLKTLPAEEATRRQATSGLWRALLAAAAVLAVVGILWLSWPAGGLGAGPEAPPFAPGSNIELNVLPKRDAVQLTIYNSADLTLVREQRRLTLKKGWNWLQFGWANTLVDPTSLELRPVGAPQEVEIQQLVYPPRTTALGRWLLHSNVSGPVDCEITYLTSGIHWRAFYVGTLARDETTMELAGYVRVDNGSGDDYEDAQTRLIVGKVHLLDQIADLARRQHPYGRPGGEPGLGGEGWVNVLFIDGHVEGAKPSGGAVDLFKETESLRPKEIKKEGLSEYFLYTIEGRERIPNGWGKHLPSFRVPAIPIVNLYKYDEERWERRVTRFLSAKNDKEHKLGETPLPDGTVRVFGEARHHADLPGAAAPGLSYVGGAPVKYIPVGEKIELELGEERQLLVEPKLFGVRTENFWFDGEGDVCGWDEVQTWQLEVRNRRDIPVKVEITRAFRHAYWALEKIEGEPTWTRHDVTHARFTLDLPAQGEQMFSFDVRLREGTRQEEK